MAFTNDMLFSSGSSHHRQLPISQQKQRLSQTLPQVTVLLQTSKSLPVPPAELGAACGVVLGREGDRAPRPQGTLPPGTQRSAQTQISSELEL